jgi:quinol monooxygenase YgiN
MSITRINEFRSSEGNNTQLREQLVLLIPVIESAQGCLSCQLLQSQKDENHFVVIEVWDDVESHQASLKDVRPEVFHELKKYLAVPPTGEYYDYCHAR